jgi:hypothetical protein
MTDIQRAIEEKEKELQTLRELLSKTKSSSIPRDRKVDCFDPYCFGCPGCSDYTIKF